MRGATECVLSFIFLRRRHTKLLHPVRESSNTEFTQTIIRTVIHVLCSKMVCLPLRELCDESSYRYIVGIGLKSTLALSGRPSGVCGVHRLMVDSLREICEPSLPPPPSGAFDCISCRFIPLLRLLTASYHPINILSETKRHTSRGAGTARELYPRIIHGNSLFFILENCYTETQKTMHALTLNI